MSLLAGVDLVERSADPARVRAGLSRLCDAHPGIGERLDTDADLAAAVVAILAASRSLGRRLVLDPMAMAALEPGAQRAPAPSGDIGGVVSWKSRELLRIAGRDLRGIDSLEQTTGALSAMAVTVLRVAHHHGDQHLGQGDRLALIGMGKVGAAELNYASDVDVLLVGEGDPERLHRAGRTVIEVASRAFRIDVDLRPEGRDGPLVRSVDSYVAYWERWAEPWERQALLKASPLVGDGALGAAWAEAARAVTWDQPFGTDELRHIRALKVRSEDAVRARGTRERDVKRGRGGIRDVEFAAQLLQLVHGRVDTDLRVRGTLEALDRLQAGGYVDPDDVAVLSTSYRFLRRVEHALQLEDERQTHVVPSDRDDRRRVARVLGFRGAPAAGPTEAFDRELARHRSGVRRVHERVWFRPLLASLSGAGPLGEMATAQRLEAFGFADVERTRQAVVELTSGLTRTSRMMEQLLPLLLDWLSASPDPDLGLLGLRRLASGERRSTDLAIAFRDSPEVARRLALLLGTSRWMGDILVANPDLIERLSDPDRLRTQSSSDLRTSALSGIVWRGAIDERQRALLRWKQRHLLGIAARDVFGNAGVAQVGEDLSRVAEATLEAALQTLDPQVPFAVVAFGGLGGSELGYRSDLDIAFVHDGSDRDEAARVASGLLRFVGGDTPADRIWAVDADLRPEGRSGPVERSIDAWEAYLERWASMWERQAYLRARPVAGDRHLGGRLVEHISAAIRAHPVSPDDEREVRRMKVRIDKERMAPGEDPGFHLKLGHGSLSDVEFTVQLLQLQHGVPGASTLRAMGSLVEAGHLPIAEAEVLEESYLFCEGTRNRSHLVAGPGDAIPRRPELATLLARSLGYTVAELREEFRRVTRRARRVVERRFYDSQ